MLHVPFIPQSELIRLKVKREQILFPQHAIIQILGYSCGWQRIAGSRRGSTWDLSTHLSSKTMSLCASVFWWAMVRATPSR